MSTALLHEPDKYWSACQAALILLALVVPLVWTVSFRQQFAPTPLVVSISAPPVVQEAPPEIETPDLQKIQERIEAAKAEQEQAEIARRREKAAEKERELEERRRQEEEQERQRLEEERKREELEKRLEQEKAEEERKRQEVQRRREEQQRLLDEEKRRQEEAEAQRQAEAEAKLKADRDARIMSRYIAAIHERVERHLSNPEGVAADIQVEVRVLLDSSGKLAALPEVVSSSGHVQYDEEAVHAVILGAANGFELPSDDNLRSQFSELLLTIKPRAN